MKKLKSLISILFLICSLTLTSAQEKVVILDSIQSNKIINELTHYDFLKFNDSIQKIDLERFKKLDSISQARILNLKESASKLEKAYSKKESETNDLNGIIINWEKIYKRTNTTKAIYKYGFWGLVLYNGIKLLLLK